MLISKKYSTFANQIPYNMTSTASKMPSIWLCIFFDLVGMSSFFIPVYGEWIDMVWAPIAALMFYLLFGGRTGAIGAVGAFVEEALPFADILPVFTIGYFVRKYSKKQN